MIHLCVIKTEAHKYVITTSECKHKYAPYIPPSAALSQDLLQSLAAQQMAAQQEAGFYKCESYDSGLYSIFLSNVLGF